MAKNDKKAVADKPTVVEKPAVVEKPKAVKVNWKKDVLAAKAEFNRFVAVEMTARGNEDSEAVASAVAAVVEHTQAFTQMLQKSGEFAEFVNRIFAANHNVDWNELFDAILARL